ncbi:MAG: acyclic terpene utilization AtuA family protein [Armatimonadota bacterium]
MDRSLTYLSLCGMLGYGYPLASLQKGLEAAPDFIGVDAGSTDPGPYYLGSGEAFVKRSQVARDLGPALEAAIERDIPLIIGTAGGAGARRHVGVFMEILREVAADRSLRFDAAIIYADVEPDVVEAALEANQIRPCGPVPPLQPGAADDCTNLVAQMSTSPLIKALQTGAEVIVAGRSCDTAIFAAVPIMRGYDPALAFHAAKIAECGTLCARPGGANDALLCTLAEDHFTVRPPNPEKACYPDTVAAHTLYEQPDPDRFVEPEGIIDISECEFGAVEDRGVTVRGTRLHEADSPCLKIEGAALRGYRTISVAGSRDPHVIAHLDEIEQTVRASVEENTDIPQSDYSLQFITYGKDAIWQDHEPSTQTPHEVGIVIEAIAPTQQQSDAICSLARSTALHQHFEDRKTTAGNFAFPFSPSDFSGGAVYEFAIYHLMDIANERDMFPVRVEEVGS